VSVTQATNMEKLLNLRNTIIVVGVLTLWRLDLSAGLQLHPDEAYYWLWSRHLDIAYYDHSPLVAYFIWITTLFSETELWVRLSGTIVTLITSILMWQLAIQLFRNSVVAAGSVILFNVYPLTMLGLIVITPDIPLFMFWSLSVYLFWQIMRSNKTWLWYALGVSFGLALLSKYTAILLLPCFFLYLLITEDRRWLKTFYPYVSLLIGLLCFLPVVFWNNAHDWVSFKFQLGHGLNGQDYSFGRVVEYIVGQLLVTGPIAWLLGMYSAFVWLFRKDKEQLFLILTTLPVIMFFGFTSLKTVAAPNWPVFVYFSFSILVTKYFLDSPSLLRRSLWYSALLISLLLSSIMTLHAKFGVIPLARFSKELAIADPTNQFYGWRELGAEFKKYPDMKFAVTPSHQLAAEIIYYTNENLFVQTDRKATRTSQFDLWPWPNEFKEKNGFYVWEEGSAVGPYSEYFTSNTVSDTLTIFRGGVAIRSFRIVAGQYRRTPPFPGD